MKHIIPNLTTLKTTIQSLSKKTHDMPENEQLFNTYRQAQLKIKRLTNKIIKKIKCMELIDEPLYLNMLQIDYLTLTRNQEKLVFEFDNGSSYYLYSQNLNTREIYYCLEDTLQTGDGSIRIDSNNNIALSTDKKRIVFTLQNGKMVYRYTENLYPRKIHYDPNDKKYERNYQTELLTYFNHMRSFKQLEKKLLQKQNSSKNENEKVKTLIK